MNRAVLMAVAFAVVAVPARAFCEPGPDQEQPDLRYGVGYKAGNGHGFYGGDLLLRATPRLWFVLYGGAVWESGGRGFALAPTMQANLRRDGSTPYVSLGLEYTRVLFDEVWGDGFGFLINTGYEWRLGRGVALQFGVGLRALQEITGSSAMTTVVQRAFIAPNAELGLRYRFP